MNSPFRPGGASAPSPLLSRTVLIVFLVSLLVGGIVITRHTLRQAETLRTHALTEATSFAAEAQRHLVRGLGVTSELGRDVRQAGGNYTAFPSVAAELHAEQPGIARIEIAPNGVVSEVSPRAGNESLLRRNLFTDPVTRTAAQAAFNARRLVAEGPVRLPSGEPGLVGRLPVYLKGRDGREQFWGFVTVALRLNQIPRLARLEELGPRGYDYSFYAPARGPQAGLTLETNSRSALRHPIIVPIRAANVEFALALAPRGGTVAWGEVVFTSLLALGFAIVLAGFVQALERRRGAAAAVAEANVRSAREQERFRTLLEAAPDALILADRAGRIQLVNAQAEKLFGWTRKEFIGQPVELLLPERLRKGHPTHRTRYLGAPTTRAMGVGLELAALRKDGSEFPVEISLSPIESPDGGGAWVCSSVRDITARRRAEAELAAAREKAVAAIRRAARVAVEERQRSQPARASELAVEPIEPAVIIAASAFSSITPASIPDLLAAETGAGDSPADSSASAGDSAAAPQIPEASESLEPPTNEPLTPLFSGAGVPPAASGAGVPPAASPPEVTAPAPAPPAPATDPEPEPQDNAPTAIAEDSMMVIPEPEDSATTAEGVPEVPAAEPEPPTSAVTPDALLPAPPALVATEPPVLAKPVRRRQPKLDHQLGLFGEVLPDAPPAEPTVEPPPREAPRSRRRVETDSPLVPPAREPSARPRRSERAAPTGASAANASVPAASPQVVVPAQPEVEIPPADGLDAAAGLRHADGNGKRYLRLLGQFVEQQAGSAERIRDLLVQGDFVAAERAAHLLKDAAGSLGATAVHAAAADLERAIHQPADPAEIEQLWAVLDVALTGLVKELKPALRPPPVKSAAAVAPLPPLDLPQFRKAARDMLPLLSDLDPGAADCLAANHETMRAAFAPEGFAEFVQNVKGAAFAEALELLKKAAKKHGVSL